MSGWLPPENLIDTAADYALKRLKEIYPPGSRRHEPLLWFTDAANLIGVHDRQIRDAINAGAAKPISGEKRDYLTAAQIQRVRQHLHDNSYKKTLIHRKPEGSPPYVIAVSNLKGGSGKSTMTAHAAAWFALKGYRTLVIDADPQGTTTTIMGLLPVLNPPDPDDDMPSHPLMIAPDESLFTVFDTEQISKPRSTFWNGSKEPAPWNMLDIVPAVIDDYYSEMVIAAKKGESEVPFNMLLRKAIDTSPATQNYDVVIIDTPPSFSNITMNAIYAAHALLIPVPPDTLGVQATFSYFDKLDEIFVELEKLYPDNFNRLDFVKAVRVRYNMQPESIDNSAMVEAVMKDVLLEPVVFESKTYRSAAQYNLTVFEGLSNELFSRRLFIEAFSTLTDIFSNYERAMLDYWAGLRREDG
ncbi:hypothetical protein D6779_06345 [Candidatus Parcubacteria bacterium]|nr:MAG: hypothetical protein D6779_06345 [Candidatus Parcubacteria bacterium]